MDNFYYTIEDLDYL